MRQLQAASGSVCRSGLMAEGMPCFSSASGVAFLASSDLRTSTRLLWRVNFRNSSWLVYGLNWGGGGGGGAGQVMKTLCKAFMSQTAWKKNGRSQTARGTPGSSLPNFSPAAGS